MLVFAQLAFSAPASDNVASLLDTVSPSVSTRRDRKRGSSALVIRRQDRRKEESAPIDSSSSVAPTLTVVGPCVFGHTSTSRSAKNASVWRCVRDAPLLILLTVLIKRHFGFSAFPKAFLKGGSSFGG